jgi:hypothetical protein
MHTGAYKRINADCFCSCVRLEWRCRLKTDSGVARFFRELADPEWTIPSIGGDIAVCNNGCQVNSYPCTNANAARDSGEV